MKYIKYLPWALVVLALCAVSVYQWKAASAARDLATAKNSELMKANLEIGRANTKLVNQKKLHEVALKEIDKKWKAEISKRQASVEMYAELEARYIAETKKKKIETRVVFKDKPITVDLPKNKLFVRKDSGEYQEVDSLEWTYKDFRINIKGDALKETLSYKLTQKFNGQLVKTKLPTGGTNYYFRLWEIDNKNKKVGELKLDKFEVLEAKPSKGRMYWWNPKLDLHLGFGTNTRLKFNWLGDIGLSMSGYGATKDDLRWRFLRLGAGMTGNGFSLSFSPAQYNIAKHLPLISNIYLIPSIGYSLNQKDFFFTFGIGSVL